MTEKVRPVFGYAPVSMYFTQVLFTPSGTSCSLLHATVQAWQPMQESLARTKPRRVISGPSREHQVQEIAVPPLRTWPATAVPADPLPAIKMLVAHCAHCPPLDVCHGP